MPFPIPNHHNRHSYSVTRIDSIERSAQTDRQWTAAVFRASCLISPSADVWTQPQSLTHCVGLQYSVSSLHDLASRIFKNSVANHKQTYLLHRTQIFWSLSKYQQLTTTLPRIELTLADIYRVHFIWPWPTDLHKWFDRRHPCRLLSAFHPCPVSSTGSQPW